MNTDIWASMTDVFRDVLGDDRLTLTPTTTASDVEGWDSITHVMIIVGIESRFAIKLSTAEVQQLKNAGELCETIERKLQAKKK